MRSVLLSFLALLLGATFFFAGCRSGIESNGEPYDYSFENQEEQDPNEVAYEAYEDEGDLAFETPELDELSDYEEPGHHLVDMRFELVSLIFRLAGRREYMAGGSAYHGRLAISFADFAGHPAVEYARLMSGFISFSYPFWFAMHLDYENGRFALADDISGLVRDGRWTPLSAARFTELVNEFYRDTSFAEFFHSEPNMDYFVNWSERIFRDVYSEFDREWFEQFGLPYQNLRILYAPSKSYVGPVAPLTAIRQGDLGEIFVFAALKRDTNFGRKHIYEIPILALARAISHPLGSELYEFNDEFRRMVDSSVEQNATQWYTLSYQMSLGYLTRALLYMYFEDVHGREDVTFAWLNSAIQAGVFPYLDEVYDMVRSMPAYEVRSLVQGSSVSDWAPVGIHDMADLQIDSSLSESISAALGSDFAVLEELSFFDLSGMLFHHWFLLDVFERGWQPDELQFGEAGIISTRTGDVLVAATRDARTGEVGWRVLIDIGYGGTGHGSPGMRAFHRLPLED